MGTDSKKVWGDQKTQFFYELSPEKILASTEKIGLPATGRILQLNSMENRVYDIEVDVDPETSKTKYDSFRIIKFYRPGRWSQAQIAEEHRYLQDLVDNEIPVVAPISLENGSSIGECDGLFFSIFPKIGGRAPDELTADQFSQVGRLLGRMHQVGKSRPVEHRVEITPESFAVDNMTYLKEEKLIPVDLESRYFEACQQIVDLMQAPLKNCDKFRIHGDCHLGNLLWAAEGPFWVDFDDMLLGPAVQDIWLMLPGRDEHALEMRRQLLAGYTTMCDFNPEELRMIEGLRALRIIHFSGWIARRWEDPSFQRAFEYFNTYQYWSEQTRDLETQAITLRNQLQATYY